jgi:hypothetical protein
MRRGIRKASRQSNPGSLIFAQRTVSHSVQGAARQPKTIICLDTRSGEEMLVSESETYGAVCNSFCTVDHRPFSIVMRELLEAGTILANTKGLFRKPIRFGTQKQPACDGLAISALRRVAEMALLNLRAAH